MVPKYYQYEVLNFADKLHIQYIPSNCFLYQTLQNTHKKHMNDEKSDYKAYKKKQNTWYKKLSEPKSDNLSKDITWTKYILEITYK